MENLSNILSLYQQVHRKTLTNGLVILLYPTKEMPIINFQLWVKAGSIYENKYLGSGISHCLEHCLFLGSKKFPKQGEYSKFIEMRGAADNNAHTSYDHTAFHFSLDKSYLSDGLKILSDTIFYPLFPQKRFLKEKKVILAEMDMDLDDPEMIISENFFEKIYPNHPYRFPIIGYRDEFMKITRQFLLSYFNEMYIPSNMVLALTGDFEISKANDLIEKYFSNKKNYINSPNIYSSTTQNLNQHAWHFSNTYLDAQLPRAKMGFPSCDILDNDAVALDIIDILLSYGKNAYFYKKYLADNSLNHIESHSWTPTQQGYFEISLFGTGEQLKDKKKNILEDLSIFLKQLSEEDIQGAKLKLHQDITLNLESPIGINQSIIASEIFTDNFHFEYNYLLKLEKIDKKQLQAVVNKYLIDSNLIYSEYHPLENQPKNFLKKKTITTPCQKISLNNGLKIVYKNKSIQNIHLSLVFKGGLEYENKENNGIFQLLSKMLFQGAKKESEEKITKFFENLGCIINTFSSDSSFGFTLSFLKIHEIKIYKKILVILNEANFPADKLNILKEKTLEDLKLDEENIWEIHGKEFKKHLFKNSVLSLNVSGDETSLNNINNHQIIDLYNKYAVSENATLGLMGDIDISFLKGIFTKFRSGKTNIEPPSHKSTSLKYLKPISKIIPKQQTIYRIAFETVSFNEEDSKYFNLLSHYFNGLGGPLFKIREITGDAYHIECSQISRRMTGHFIFSFVLAAHSKKDALWVKKIVLDNIKKIKKGKIQKDNLKRAITSMQGSKSIAMQYLPDQSLQIAQFELLSGNFTKYYDECDFLKKKFSFLHQYLETMANKYFLDDNYILMSVGNKK